MSDERRLQRFRRTLEGLVGIPATEGNAVDVLRNGDRIFPAMLDAIRSATSTVDLLSYVYWTGQVADDFAAACCERARAGVRVRILLDAVGAMQMNRELVHQMEAAGCHLQWFRQPTTWKLWEANSRSHRKVLVCDEAVAFIGGVGIAEEWEGDARTPNEWRDTHLRVRGPAVDGLRAAFVTNWAETGQPLFTDVDRFPEQPPVGDSVVQVVSSPSQQGWSVLCSALTALIACAQERLRISTAYFVPDEVFRDQLCGAARRGVQVDVLVPGPHMDKRVVQVAPVRPTTPTCSPPGSGSGSTSRPCSTPRSSPSTGSWRRSGRPTSTSARCAPTRRPTSSCSTPAWWPSSTATSRRTWRRPSASTRPAGCGAASRSGRRSGSRGCSTSTCSARGGVPGGAGRCRASGGGRRCCAGRGGQ